MTKIKKIVFIFLFSFLPFFQNLMAQQIAVKATIDSTDILIGQQTLIKLEVLQPQNIKLNFPNYNIQENLTDGVEILAISKPDTIKSSNNKITIKQDYLITSFDSGSYSIPPFKFLTPEQTYQTNSLSLNVQNIQKEIKEGEFKDIKPIYEPPFDWLSFILVLLAVLLGIAIIGTAIYFYIRKKKNKPIPIFEKKGVKLLSHEIALQKLEEIKNEKIWQKGQNKLYYTQITDTLREYFIERFHIPAMEMTSGEILNSLNSNEEAKIILDKLKQIFMLSDMVKFAKKQPSSEENDLSIVNAFFIVNQTIIHPIVSTTQESEKNNSLQEEEKTTEKISD